MIEEFKKELMDKLVELGEKGNYTERQMKILSDSVDENIDELPEGFDMLTMGLCKMESATWPEDNPNPLPEEYAIVFDFFQFGGCNHCIIKVLFLISNCLHKKWETRVSKWSSDED